MKPSMLHIVLSFVLLVSYGMERLLPCSGIWDVDCPDAQAERIGDVPVQAHDDHGHSDDSESSSEHGDHQCNCPCHAVAITSAPTSAVAMIAYPQQHGSCTLSLPHAALSPPDHIPIA